MKKFFSAAISKPKPAYSIPVGPGSTDTIEVSDKEQQYMNAIFDMLDEGKAEQLSGQIGAKFLRRSGIADEKLRETWRLACGGKSRAALGRNEWICAGKLVALAQTGSEVTMAALRAAPELDLADFNLGNKPFTTPGSPAPVPPGALQVFVENPQLIRDSAAKSHIQYTVRLSTSLEAMFGGKTSARVPRRYSDFAWLDERLQAKFPSHLLPALPPTAMQGNTSAAFVEERLRGLQQYMDVLCTMPLVVSCLEFYVFTATLDSLEYLKTAVAILEPKEAKVMTMARSLWGAVSHRAGASGGGEPAGKYEDFHRVLEAHGRESTAVDQMVTQVDATLQLRSTIGDTLIGMNGYLRQLGSALQEISATLSIIEVGSGFNSGLMAHDAADTTYVSGASAMGQGASPTMTPERRGTRGHTTTTMIALDQAAMDAYKQHQEAEKRRKERTGIASMFDDDIDEIDKQETAPEHGGGAFDHEDLEDVMVDQSLSVSFRKAQASATTEKAENVSDLVLMLGVDFDAMGRRYHEQADRSHKQALGELITLGERSRTIDRMVARRFKAVELLKESQAALESARKRYAKEQAKPALEPLARIHVEKAEALCKRRTQELDDITTTANQQVRALQVERQQTVHCGLKSYISLEHEFARNRMAGWADLTKIVEVSPSDLAARDTRKARLLEQRREQGAGSA